MAEVKTYSHGNFLFEFTPSGKPYIGTLVTTFPEVEPYGGKVDLSSKRSRSEYANEASEMCGMNEKDLRAALISIFTKRTEEISAAREAAQNQPQEIPEDEVAEEEISQRISVPGVLDRLVEDIANFSRVVRDRNTLKLLTLVSLSAQLDLLPNGKPIGANNILTAEPGRGKNYLCDAVARVIPEDFYFAFESSSAKSLYYAAESDPAFLKHRWIYPNEAEATDSLVLMFRPLLSGGLAKHLTVNSDASGRNTGQEYTIEGPITITIPTVRNKLDSQLQSRMLVAELEDYEGRVADHSGAVSELLSRDYAGSDHTEHIRAWKAALRSLTNIRRVVIPEHPDFRFDSDQVSYGARLWTNVLGLMCTHAWLEQRNREVISLGNGERAIVATPKDYEAAYEIFKETCERSVINLSDLHRKILDAVYALTEEAKGEDDTTLFFSPGFAQRKIEDKSRTLHGKAYVRQASISENKTFLVKSAKLLWEPSDGGLALAKGADPSWWEKGDALDGFPKPEQVKIWWTDDSSPDPSLHKSAHHPNGQDDREANGDDREVSDHKNGLSKPNKAGEAEDIGDIGSLETSEDKSSTLGALLMG